MNSKQHGFTLIDLLIAVAIVGLLAQIALPAYQRYSDRAAFSELILEATARKNAIIIAAEIGRIHSLNDIHEGKNGIPEKQHQSETEHGIHVHDGVIIAQWKKDGSILDGVKFELTAQNFVPPIQWQTGGDCVALGYC